jgi:uncharacterized membrane protein YkoI
MNKIIMMMMVSLVVNVANAENNIPASELPDAVAVAIKSICPEGTIHEVEMEKDDGQIEYEVELMIGKKSCDLKLADDGSVLEIEKEMDLKQLPKKVQKTVALFVDAELEKAEQVQEDGAVTYEVILEIDEEEFELELSKDGKILEMESEDDDDDDD